MVTVISKSSLVLLSRLIIASCCMWMLSYTLIGGTTSGKVYFSSCFMPNDKAGTPLIAITIPILVAGAVASIMVVIVQQQQQQQYTVTGSRTTHIYQQKTTLCVIPWLRDRIRNGSFSYYNGTNFSDIGIYCIVLPCLILAICTIHRHWHEQQQQEVDRSTNIALYYEIANTWGYVALVAVSVLLIPVTRYGVLLIGWDTIAIVHGIHVWTGRFVLVAVLCHAILHMVRWKQMLGETIVNMILPPYQCFFGDIRQDKFQPICNNILTECTCYDLVRNWTGLAAATLLMLIGITSLNVVRRKFYTMFYTIHILAGPTMLFCVILHWNRSMIFLAGGALYYIACSFPVFVEQWHKRRIGSAVRLVSVERIECTRYVCFAITLEASDMAIQHYRPGQYVQLKVPMLSEIAHPFSINTTIVQYGCNNNSDGDPPLERKSMLRVIFRSKGSFTQKLGQWLTAAMEPSQRTDHNNVVSDHNLFPKIYLDGYHGCTNRLEQVFRHDAVVIVAGGIGITPYLSLLREIQNLAFVHRSVLTKKVDLHWVCRDLNLIDYVKRGYFDDLFISQSSSIVSIRIRIVIHQTTGHTEQGHTSCTNVLPANDDDRCIHQSMYVEVPLEEQDGVPFSPSRFSPTSKTNMHTAAIFFLSYVLTTGVGLTAILYFYFYWQSNVTILSRLASPLFIVVWGSIQAFVFHCVYNRMRTNPECHFSTQWEPIIGVDESDERKETTSVELGQVDMSSYASATQQNDTLAVEGTTGSVGDRLPSVQLEERLGRPSVHHYLNSLDTAQYPGFFVCGPAPLLHDIRAATKDRCAMRLQRCASGVSHIALYEESFEL